MVTGIIFSVCLFGCGIQCWHIGRKFGKEETIDYLVEAGILDLEE